jgi:hypothetical protein
MIIKTVYQFTAGTNLPDEVMVQALCVWYNFNRKTMRCCFTVVPPPSFTTFHSLRLHKGLYFDL